MLLPQALFPKNSQQTRAKQATVACLALVFFAILPQMSFLRTSQEQHLQQGGRSIALSGAALR